MNAVYYLPAWVPASDYVKLVNDLGLKDVRSDDWSTYVLPFWPAVIRSALVPTNFFKMIRSGMMTIKGAIASVSDARCYYCCCCCDCTNWMHVGPGIRCGCARD